MKLKYQILAAFMAIVLQAYPQLRIVTAGSSSSEIVCALGACDQIVATDRTSRFPEMLQALPSIGYRSGIGAEGIISMKPDLVIFEEEYVKDEVVAQLKSTGIRTLLVGHEQNFESTKQRIRAISAELGKEPEGEALIEEIGTGLDKVKVKVDATTSRPRVLCVFNRGTGTMMVAGRNTSFGLIPLAGAVNAMAEVEGYKPLNTESLIQADPDYILFFASGLESIGGVDGALKIAGVAQTTAGKKRQIIAIDGIVLTNWGPRVAEAAMQLFQLTHPETAK